MEKGREGKERKGSLSTVWGLDSATGARAGAVGLENEGFAQKDLAQEISPVRQRKRRGWKQSRSAGAMLCCPFPGFPEAGLGDESVLQNEKSEQTTEN